MSVIEGPDHNHAASAVIHRDATLNNLAIPRLTDDLKVLLLDIMGCTTSINSFKKDMLPYIDQQIASYVNRMTLDNIKSLFFKLQRVVDEMSNERIKFDCIDVAISKREFYFICF